ncbi:MAG: T9SS type A sorting domain-containing protein [Candidatus Latescibacterota bacterium]|nr:MAG: T9SS type A sorting domain-containing protein [Candidatus Latescibacterota bacterium]
MKRRLLLVFAVVLILVLSSPALGTENGWQIVGTISGFVDPTGITFDGTWIWATEQHASSPLYKIDPETLSIEETHFLSVPSCCVQGLAWDGRYIWISGDGYTIYRFDPVTSDLQHTCTRAGSPQVIGLTAIGSEIWSTGWYGGYWADCNLMTLNPNTCDYTELAVLDELYSAWGLAWAGDTFFVCARAEPSFEATKHLYSYSPAGELINDYGDLGFGAYDVAWDGEFLWIADYGMQNVADGKIHKISLAGPSFLQLSVYEQTGAIQRYSFPPSDERLYQMIPNPGPVDLGYEGYDFGTGGCEYYDVYFSDRLGNPLGLSPADPLPEPTYLTINCLDLNCNNGEPDPAPSWQGAGNNLESVVLETNAGDLWAVELTRIRYGLCEDPWPLNHRPAENILGPPDDVITGMGGGNTSVTLRFGTLLPVVCGGVNNARISKVGNVERIHLWDNPVDLSEPGVFDPLVHPVRISVDGTEIIIPAASLRRVGQSAKFVYRTAPGSVPRIHFTLDLESHTWGINRRGVGVDEIDNSNGVTVHFSCAGYFMEETFPMEAKPRRGGKGAGPFVLSYSREPPLSCDGPLPPSSEKDEVPCLCRAGGADGDPPPRAACEHGGGNRRQNPRGCARDKGDGRFSQQNAGVSETILHRNYPNPFNPTTTISFSLSHPADVTLVIYNIVGQKIATLEQGRFGTGVHYTDWDGTSDLGESVASGVYFCRLRVGEILETRRMVLLK